MRSAGIDPDPRIALSVIDSLPEQATELRRQRPRRVTVADLTAAWRVITFNLDRSELPGSSINVQQWDDVLAVGADPMAARLVIERHVNRLFDDLSHGGRR